MESVSSVLLCLGSNLGDRLTMLKRAIQLLGGHASVRVVRSSSVYESEPWGLTDQPKYFNIVVEIETVLTPLELLKTVKDVEQQLGRQPSEKWGPRSIDIDLILWGSHCMRTPELTIPHQLFRDRAFVLAPLAEIAPAAVDPESGMTVTALAGRVDAGGLVQIADPLFS
ncbi:MAG TPA: 2-amino-4-hydroxy-6-hydroxymethyldihydropteridine diphosphokinase [Candidatus Hydrogenedentes bacterium]|jgi:2-amino-4-hydroxy-6-hydroxymethyldihydropteridine diphosphokinase|nr:MAG: 2-amino-4-hydroxy-6-hydroxymethyldihydropteridine pyrophosphokinase [Candidatus Hydrogenedentes bacterium ADurb.Bin170]HNZ47664.1 2-amino-4-hydroxy-6-hydroxymethyldihydropteridine diphosphokinase [Candidatus Hydrogenedentota bacterium]HOD95492.1 2-amino-4-hydroxy-6-hydroxymethyldihydropteridine diphosphokinase [Candidatus Hydrogenedentota bacterium]HOM47489.1 2-amino-4-hydroxy-6-hydroxymethyldihydropteridine diphosphokinase [Candidatus Hydrogenedentota bacterium]HOR50947.1 2-amino-4-hyd